MRRNTVWNASSRVLDDKWQEEQFLSHRARLESIHALPSFNTARASSLAPQRGTASPFKAAPKSKSPAARSRQAEIERENLKMIKKIVELQNRGVKKRPMAASRGEAPPPRDGRHPRPASAGVCRQTCRRDHGETTYEPGPFDAIGGFDEEPTRVPGRGSHVLYTRTSATMTHHFPEQNDLVLNHVSRSSQETGNCHQRQRTQVQIREENRKMLQRILSAKTSFSRTKWQEDEHERRKLLSNISRFAYLKKRHSSPTGSPTHSPTRRRQQEQLVRGDDSESGGPRALYARGSHSARSAHTLVVVDGTRAARGLEASAIIRTGSPVTHLRQRRPMSASAAPGSRAGPRTTLPIDCDEDVALLTGMMADLGQLEAHESAAAGAAGGGRGGRGTTVVAGSLDAPLASNVGGDLDMDGSQLP